MTPSPRKPMSDSGAALEIRCCCPSTDPEWCARIRLSRLDDEPIEPCECVCHDYDEDLPHG